MIVISSRCEATGSWILQKVILRGGSPAGGNHVRVDLLHDRFTGGSAIASSSNDGVLPNPLADKHPVMVPPSRDTFSDSTRALILHALRATGWVIGGPGGAAARPGLKRTTLIAKMKKFGISRPVEQTDITDLTENREGGELWQPAREWEPVPGFESLRLRSLHGFPALWQHIECQRLTVGVLIAFQYGHWRQHMSHPFPACYCRL